MHMAGDIRQIEFPPVERPSLQVKIDVGPFLAVQRYSAVDLGRRRRSKLVILDGFYNMWAYRAGDHHRFRCAEAVGEVNQLSGKVESDPVRFRHPGPHFNLRFDGSDILIGVKHLSDKRTETVATESKIGQPDLTLNTCPFRVITYTPCFNIQLGRLRQSK